MLSYSFLYLTSLCAICSLIACEVQTTTEPTQTTALATKAEDDKECEKLRTDCVPLANVYEPLFDMERLFGELQNWKARSANLSDEHKTVINDLVYYVEPLVDDWGNETDLVFGVVKDQQIVAIGNLLLSRRENGSVSEYLIDHMAVAPNMQGQGAGRAWMLALARMAEKSNAEIGLRLSMGQPIITSTKLRVGDFCLSN